MRALVSYIFIDKYGCLGFGNADAYLPSYPPSMESVTKIMNEIEKEKNEKISIVNLIPLGEN